MEKPKKLKPSEILMDAIGFDEEDLASNQEGQVSQNQRNLSIRNRNLWLASVTICCAIVLVGIIGIINTDFMNFNNNLKAIIFPGLIGLFCSRNAIHLNIEAKDKRVVFAEGRITLDISGNNTFVLSIDGQQFHPKKEIFLAFKNGDPYRIYYSPRSKRILSAEWLRD